MRIKQVILIRKDLKMRRGKEIAQGSHASMDFLIERLANATSQGSVGASQSLEVPDATGESKKAPEATASLHRITIEISETERQWMLNGMAKICLQINSEEELKEMFHKANQAGLTAHMIQDSGRTEFDGKPTLTAVAIGPNDAEAIDQITKHLSLY